LSKAKFAEDQVIKTSNRHKPTNPDTESSSASGHKAVSHHPPIGIQRPIMDNPNPRHVPHLHNYLHDPPSLMHSGAFHISNNMAASSTGPITPIYELPPSMMGQVSGDTVPQPSNAAMDYFDFDLSTFAMEGGLESTGITLDPVPEEIDLDGVQAVADQGRIMESRSQIIANGMTEPIWSNNDETQHGKSAEGFVQAAVMTGQQLHEQVRRNGPLSTSIAHTLRIVPLPHSSPNSICNLQPYLPNLMLRNSNSHFRHRNISTTWTSTIG
jgi:hypothetical protein